MNYSQTKRVVRQEMNKWAKLSLNERDSTVISVRIPRSWLDALHAMETDELNLQRLVRRAIRKLIHEGDVKF